MTSGHRLLFVGGLHRSGTTPLAHWLARHPAVSELSGTGVYEDEGQHLQGVYRTAAQHGGPGRFALDPEAHLTESAPLVSAESRRRLWSAWSPYWDLSRPVLLEKSPPNLVRMRFLEALFGTAARFAMIVRHPIAVAYATKRWTGLVPRVPAALPRRGHLQGTLGLLVRHWVEAHERFLADAERVEKVALVRYEDVVADPVRELAGIFRLCDLEPVGDQFDVRPGINQRYVARYRDETARGPRHLYARRVAAAFEDRVRPFGYSLRDPAELRPPMPSVARFQPLR